MRLWSIHPKYLDSKGMVALWRETLLAQNVLLGKTKGYKNHPQLLRFKQCDNPISAIGNYLLAVWEEAERRGYHFNKAKIVAHKPTSQINVTDGQVRYEFEHLLNKLRIRDPERFQALKERKRIELHPLFTKVKGEIEAWEVVGGEK